MIGPWALLCLSASIAAEPIQTRLLQTSPARTHDGEVVRTKDQQRAIVLIHGLRRSLQGGDKVSQPLTRGWQEAGSTLVTMLEPYADLFAFAYGQNASLDEITSCTGLRGGIARIRASGYTNIVLVGHSAGGLIARHFVEDNPDAGVTKVVQVCSPNSGSAFAHLAFIAPSTQRPFIDSLSPEAREGYLRTRKGKKFPVDIEFVCILGHARGSDGDGVVSFGSQWPKDLQVQGIPVAFVDGRHADVVTDRDSVLRIAEITIEPTPRWKSERVAEARRKIQMGLPGLP